MSRKKSLITNVSNKNLAIDSEKWRIRLLVITTYIGALRGMKPVKAGRTGMIPISVIR
jgi:hypothetical protein